MYQSCLLILTTMVYKRTNITLFVFTYIAMRMDALLELLSLESSISEIFLANRITCCKIHQSINPADLVEFLTNKL